ncbi:hypothetical protein A6V39_04620 [Candidatus Mycoplasma haematobovis]|uniref:Uncharacterized protein n=1 Tax=Candidatus Mycoplasma haematobovis TaxID=432608 RepID=A0A1A9QD61_9MOLU|nr:hypothetical protein [Candidatus Mycoplasma haematobovis]OAL10168.1 hypothetical protein A6V39_04620 [Candidatus Mycoplasma haematobovis]
MAGISDIFGFIANFFSSFLGFFEEKGRLRAKSEDFEELCQKKQQEVEEMKAKIDELEKNAEDFKEKVKLIDFLGGFEEMQKIIDDYGSFAKIREKLLEREQYKLKQAEYEKTLEENFNLVKENIKLKSELEQLKEATPKS